MNCVLLGIHKPQSYPTRHNKFWKSNWFLICAIRSKTIVVVRTAWRCLIKIQNGIKVGRKGSSTISFISTANKQRPANMEKVILNLFFISILLMVFF